MQWNHLQRREFLTLIGGAAAWPLTARAQQGKLATIGVLGTATPSAWGPWIAAFVQRLRELGWIEGRTVAIEYRWAEGRVDRYAELAADLVKHKVDVLFTAGSAAPAAKRATSVTPIVFVLAGDPLGMGLVPSLARPGGNVTGLSHQAPDLAGKRIGLLREVVPGLRRLAILANAGYPAAVLEMGEVETGARTLGIEATRAEVQRVDDIPLVIGALKGRADGLYVCADPLLSNARFQITSNALAAWLPTVFVTRDYVEAGGLLSYGPSFSDQFRRAADLVDKILRGTKPADIPVEQPTKFELFISLKTAKALGLTIPESFLLRADEVIE